MRATLGKFRSIVRRTILMNEVVYRSNAWKQMFVKLAKLSETMPNIVKLRGKQELYSEFPKADFQGNKVKGPWDDEIHEDEPGKKKHHHTSSSYEVTLSGSKIVVKDFDDWVTIELPSGLSAYVPMDKNDTQMEWDPFRAGHHSVGILRGDIRVVTRGDEHQSFGWKPDEVRMNESGNLIFTDTVHFVPMVPETIQSMDEDWIAKNFAEAFSIRDDLLNVLSADVTIENRTRAARHQSRMRVTLKELKESIRTILSETSEADRWHEFEVDLMIPDDVYTEIQTALSPARHRAERRLSKDAIEHLERAGLFDVRIDWDAHPFPRLTAASWDRKRVEEAFDSSFEQPWSDGVSFFHIDSRAEGDKVVWTCEIMVRPLSDAGYRVSYESFVNDWFAPHRKELDDAGAMDIEFLPIGPAGGNPLVRCRAPSILAERVAAVLAKVAMEPPTIVPDVPKKKKGRKK